MDNGYTAKTADPESVGSLVEHLARLESQASKWEAEGESLHQAIVEAKQRIARAIKVLEEALGLNQKEVANEITINRPDPRWASS